MVFYLAFLCVAAEPTSPLSIEPTADVRRVRVVARLAPELAKTLPTGDIDAGVAQRLLSLALLDDNKPGPSIFGKYRREGDLLTFTPRYALAYEQAYRATYAISAKRTETRDYQVPARKPT